MTDQEVIIWRIADGVGAMERYFQIACGETYTDAYLADWAITALTYKMLRAEDRPAVHLEPRVVTGRGLPWSTTL